MTYFHKVFIQGVLVVSATELTKAGELSEPGSLFRAAVTNIMIAHICTVSPDSDVTPASAWETWLRTSFSFRALLGCPTTQQANQPRSGSVGQDLGTQVLLCVNSPPLKQVVAAAAAFGPCP